MVLRLINPSFALYPVGNAKKKFFLCSGFPDEENRRKTPPFLAVLRHGLLKQALGGRNADVRLKAPEFGVFIKIGLVKSPVLRGFSKSRISRLCANLSSKTDLQKLSLELRNFLRPRDLLYPDVRHWKIASRKAGKRNFLYSPVQLEKGGGDAVPMTSPNGGAVARPALPATCSPPCRCAMPRNQGGASAGAGGRS